MNLTLASHHHPIPIYPHGSGNSMERLECREGLTKQWLLDQRCGVTAAAASSSFHIPSPRLLSGGRDEATLGTTFPPQAHMLHAFRERLRLLGGRKTCHSEPDLFHGFNDEANRDDEDEGDDEDDDDDRLFEFDLCDGEENEDKSGGEDDDIQLSDGANQSRRTAAAAIITTSSAILPELTTSRKFSIGSDCSTSSSSCQHRKGGLDDTATEMGGSGSRGAAGFVGSLFGSRSSGIGSERRSSQETVSEPEGLSFEPSQWRDYMLDRLSNDGTSSTPSASASSASLASDGNATPIMEASPPVPDQPLVSPDSLLDPLEDQQPRFPASCPECALELHMSTAKHEEDMKEDEELELIVEIKDSSDDINGESQQVIFATMGPVDEDSNSERHEDSNQTDKKPIETLSAEAAEAVALPVADTGAEKSACAGTPCDDTPAVLPAEENSETELANGGAAAPVPSGEPKLASSDAAELICGGGGGGGATVPEEEEEEENSESEYAKEEEPKLGADSHLMADVQFSQQKLQELLNQLGKENITPANGASAAISAAADEANEEEKKADDVTEEQAAEPSDATATEANQASPERRQSGDQEISDHIDRAKLRKCSSLKSGRTPPGTPGVRKIVRFADIFGLDLQEVKTFTDEIPRIPRRAFQDLDVDMSDYDIGSPRGSTPVFNKFFVPPSQKPQVTAAAATTAMTTLVPMFTQPGGASNFFDTVVSKKVSLENAYMETSTSIAGIVRVLNIDYHKAVTVRWTINDWSTYAELAGVYVPGSSDGFSDKFSFRLCVGSLPIGSRIQFCLRYNSSGAEFWDSNNGTNYVFQVCLSSTSPAVVGGLSFRTTTPLSMTPRSQFTTAYHQSPSQHGDDPWLRFM